MNNIICPSCGKSNSAKVDICQFCGTALIPGATEPLAPIHTGDVPVKMETSDLERTLPGWLRDARKASDDEAPAIKDSSPATANPMEPPLKIQSPKKTEPASPFDFLAGLSKVGDEEEEVPDWLKSLQNSMPGPTNAAPPPETKQAHIQDTPAVEPAQTESPGNNWGFGSESAKFKFDEISETAGQADLNAPGWMDTLNASDEPPLSAPVSGTPSGQPVGDPATFDDLPDWMAALTEGGVEPANALPQPVSGPVEKQDHDPDWLSGLGGDFTPEEQGSSDEVGLSETPDWMARSGGELPAATESAPITAESESGQPDWLAELSGGAPVSEKEQGPLPAAVNQPDWMKDLTDSGPFPGVEAGLPETLISGKAPSVDALPEWMANLPQEPAVSQPIVPTSAEIPSWLAQTMDDETPREPVSVIPKPLDTGSVADIGGIDSGGELPDWLAGLSQPANAAEQPPVDREKDTVPELPGGADSLPQTGADLPAWLNDLPAVANETIVKSASSLAPKVEAVPLESPGKQAPPSAEDQNIESILSMDMPDWLSGFTSSEKDQKIAGGLEAQAEDSSLFPAELPSWVQAMRPMESVMAVAADSGEEQEIADDGPLAGLSSILPVQAGQAETHIPKAYSIKLLANETQQAQAALLENLLHSESEPQQVSKQARTLIVRPLRWLIAAVLLISAIIPAILGSNFFPSPGLPSEPGPLGAFIQTTANLPDSATVLVVVDYQPGYASELESVAGPVIEQLMRKNTRLAFISTSPLGSFMAERLLQKFTARYPYQVGAQYVNLGYLPGEAGGVKIFAEQPRYTVGQDPILGNLWDAQALQAVTVNNATSLANFAAVFVLTDNPDTGRIWIEQARPAMATKPLLLVVSAQAEPMIRPYVFSGQVDGLLAGLEGGAIYESALGNVGQARKDWDAFGAAMLAAELIIIIGGVSGLVISLRARRTVKEQDEA